MHNGKNIKATTSDNRGLILVSTALIMTVVFALAFALVSYIMASEKVSRHIGTVYGATQFAEAGLHKAIYCLNATTGTDCGGAYGISYGGETSVPIDAGSFTSTVTGTSDRKTITSTGVGVTGREKTLIVEATSDPPTDDIPFAFAVRSGDGGFRTENNVILHGDVRANSNIMASSVAQTITGNAYVSLPGGLIDYITVQGDAHADRILHARVNGDAYYDLDPSGIQGTEVDGIKFPGSPTPENHPLPEMNLDFWRNSAAYGGTIVGNYNPPDGSDLGPIKIEGDLTIDGGDTITLLGPIWVTGNMTIDGNADLYLDPSFEEYTTAIIVDSETDPATYGKIRLTNNVQFHGSGHPNSQILLISTNTSMNDLDPAIKVQNNAEALLFVALSGVFVAEGNAKLTSVIAKRMYLSNNVEILFGTHTAGDFNFSNGPAVVNWRLVPGTWREL